MNIGIDIDGVLTDIEQWQLDFGSKVVFEKYHTGIVNSDGYDIKEIFDVDKNLDDEFWRKYLYDYAKKEPARKFANEVTKKLSNDGNKVYIITARFLTDRDTAEGQEMREIVRNWLKENEIYYDEIIFSPEDKLEICLNNNIDVMIDDKVENINETSKHIPVICFNAGYNKECKGKNIYRAYSWYDIYSKIKEIKNKKVILNFEGSDYKTKVWINGKYVGKQIGGYYRFSFDIENYIVEGENDITIKVEDSLSKNQPRGKQRYKKESWKCWYIQTTGIWKTVWLEWVSKQYLKSVKNTPKIDKLQLEIETNLSEQDIENGNYYIETEISFNGQITNKTKELINSNLQDIEINITQEGIEHIIQKWSTQNPNLYDINYKLYYNDKVIDTVYSYFGIRDITIKENKIFLNDEQLYLKLILDQGYWKESHLTPPNEESIIKDIESVLAFGYNGVRKHQKVELVNYFIWNTNK